MITFKDPKARYNLPDVPRYCVRCTMSNQRPRMRFNEEGVCWACIYAEKKKNEIDWNAREKELEALCDKFRRGDGRHDVVVPSSGGKDSAFTAHQLKVKYGMNPLTVTWSPHLYTDIGWRNFQAHIHEGGLDNMLGTPNGKIHRELTRIAFEQLGEPFQPFAYGQVNFPVQIAAKFNIPLVMYGENGGVEYGGDMENANRPTFDYSVDTKKYYFSGLAPEDLAEYGIRKKDLEFYLPPSNEEIKKKGLEVHFFGYYKKWIPQEHYYYAVENTGFVANEERSEGTYSKYASLDDQIDGFHYYTMFVKFGIGRATSDSAHEIRDGHLTREEGVALVRKYDGEFPKKHFNTFLEYCDITEDHFNEVIDSWRSPHLWEKDGGGWKLKYQVS